MVSYLNVEITATLIFLIKLTTVEGGDDAPLSTISPTSSSIPSMAFSATATHQINNVTEPSNFSIQNYPMTECPRRRSRFQMIFFMCLIVFIPLTIIGNLTVCFVVSYTKSLRVQPMYMYMASLALADAFVGIISMPIKAKIEWDGGCFQLPMCVCWIYILEEITFSIASTIHLFAIGVDRFLALKFAYKYKQLMSRGRYAIILICIWFLSIIVSLMSTFQWKNPSQISIVPGIMGCAIDNRVYFTTLYSLFYISPVFLLMFLYWHIYKIAVRHVNEISKTEIHESHSEKKAQRRKRHLKLLRSVVFVFMAYSICWMPCIIFILVIQHQKGVLTYRLESWFKTVKFLFIDFLPHFNSTLNPFIYVISNKEFLAAVRSLVLKVPGGSNFEYQGSYDETQPRQNEEGVLIKDIKTRVRFNTFNSSLCDVNGH